MSENEDFYNKFNTNPSKKHNFKSNIFVPFISGVLGASLVLGLSFSAPSIRKALVPNISTEPSNDGSNGDSNLRNC